MLRYLGFANSMEKGKYPFLILFVLLMIMSVIGIFKLEVDPDLMVFMPNNSPSKTPFDAMNKVFENEDELIILLHTQKDTLDEDIRSTVINLHDSLAILPGVAYIVSPVMNHKFIELELLKGFSSAKLHKGEWKIFISLFADSTISRKGIREIETILSDTGLPYNISGTAYLQKRLVDIVVTILSYLPLISVFLVFMIFRLQMRSMKATFMSVIPALVGAVWTLGLAGWLGEKVSIITAIAPIFTVVIGSADGLHFVSHYLEARGQGQNKKTAVSHTLNLVGVPLIITTVTSAAGFLSLLVMDTDAVRELAIFTSAGIAFAGIATWFVLPLFLINTVNFKKEHIHPPLLKGKGFVKLWGWPSVAVVVLIFAAGLSGFPRVKTDFNQLSMFKNSTDVVQSANAIAEVHGGSMPVYVFVQHEKDILDPVLRSGIQQLSDSLRNFGGVISPYEVIDGILEQPMMRMMRYFSSEREILSDFLKQNNMPLKHMVDLEEQAVKITVLPSTITTSSLENMRNIVQSLQIERAEIRITGMSYIMEDLNQGMIANLKNTLILSITLMFILLLIAFRKFWPAVISLFPILITSWFLYGFLGLSGLALTLISSLIFSITMGINVDYAIHLSSVSLKLKSVTKGFNYAARPIMTNAIGLAIGMSVLFITPLTLHSDIAVMMWVSMMLSMFLSLTLLPTMLLVYSKRRNKNSGDVHE